MRKEIGDKVHAIVVESNKNKGIVFSINGLIGISDISMEKQIEMRKLVGKYLPWGINLEIVGKAKSGKAVFCKLSESFSKVIQLRLEEIEKEKKKDEKKQEEMKKKRKDIQNEYLYRRQQIIMQLKEDGFIVPEDEGMIKVDEVVRVTDQYNLEERNFNSFSDEDEEDEPPVYAIPVPGEGVTYDQVRSICKGLNHVVAANFTRVVWKLSSERESIIKSEASDSFNGVWPSKSYVRKYKK